MKQTSFPYPQIKDDSSYELLKEAILDYEKTRNPQLRNLRENYNAATRQPQRQAPRNHMQEKLEKVDVWALADRSAPLPEGIPADFILKEMATLLWGNITDRENRHGW